MGQLKHIQSLLHQFTAEIVLIRAINKTLASGCAGVSANSFSTRKEWFICSLDSGFRATVNYAGDGGSWLLISNPNRTKLDKLSVINYWEYTTKILSVFSAARSTAPFYFRLLGLISNLHVYPVSSEG